MFDFYKYMKDLKDEDLLLAFKECQSYWETGIIPPGKIRLIIDEVISRSGSITFPSHVMVQEISNEMARRYYHLKQYDDGKKELITAKEKITSLGWELSEQTEAWECDGNLFFRVGEKDDVTGYTVEIDPETGESRHCGNGVWCFWTEWEK